MARPTEGEGRASPEPGPEPRPANASVSPLASTVGGSCSKATRCVAVSLSCPGAAGGSPGWQPPRHTEGSEEGAARVGDSLQAVSPQPRRLDGLLHMGHEQQKVTLAA